MADLKKIAETLANLTIKEAKHLLDILKDEYGLEPPSISTLITEHEIEPVVVESVEFDVLLISVGPQKLKVIRAIKKLTRFGLIESKLLVDTAPSILKENITKAEADEFKNTLEVLGAEVTIK